MIATILEFAATAVQLVTTASEIRRKFFRYGLCLLLLAVGGGFVATGAGFLIWALYEGLSSGLASPNSARLITCMFSFGVAGVLIWAAKKMLN
ncbi:MAG: hypothetical protein V1798_05575 [Pseudomonadota bacterium]